MTIDPVAQQAAWDALGDYTGSVVVTEPKTGRILAMVSKPTYDPNTLAVHDSEQVQADVRRAARRPERPAHQPRDRRRPEPARVRRSSSSWSAAALESGKYTPEVEFPNPATLTLPGTDAVVRNSGGGTCGGGATVTIATALRLSCNIPLAELGLELGDDAIREQAEKFGFNHEFEIPTGDRAQRLPARARRRRRRALTAFGQGDVRATPLQMAMVSAAIANGGIVMQPDLVDAITAPDFSAAAGASSRVEYGRAISQETAATMTADDGQRRRKRCGE